MPLLLGCLLLGGLLLGGAPSAAPAPAPAPVVLVGISGLRWSDVSAAVTPTLWQLIGSSAVGSTQVRSARSVTCPVDGWLTISAGVNATSDEMTGERDPLNPGQVQTEGPVRCGVPTISNGLVDGWADFTEVQRDVAGAYGTLGTLGEALAQAQVCATAVGPGAGVALADSAGAVARYADAWSPALLQECPITVVDAGAIPQTSSQRTGALREFDDRVRDLVGTAPAGTSVLVTGVADPAASPPPLQVAVEHVVGQSMPSWLTSLSTRGPLAIVALRDITATLLARSEVTYAGIDGAPWEASGARELSVSQTVEDRRNVSRLSEVIPAHGGSLGAALAVMPTAVLIGCLGALVARRRGYRWAARPTFSRLAAVAALFGASLWPALYLVSAARWWQYDSPTLVLGSVTVAATLAIAAAALASRSQRPWRFVLVLSVITFATLTLDGLSGTPLQVASILGAGPVYGGRFYGFGNVTFTIYATSALLLAAVAAQVLVDRDNRRGGVAAAAGIGAVAVVIDGWPAFGADFGGLIALVPGVIVLLLLIAQVRLTYQRLGLVILTGGMAVAIVAALDYVRPADRRSHMGDFVERLVSGEAGQVLSNKADALGSSLTSPLGLIEIAVFGVMMAAALQPQRWHLPELQEVYDAWPILRSALLATGVTCALGTLVNDSGALVAGLGVVTTLPLLIATCAWWTTLPEASVVPPVAVAPA